MNVLLIAAHFATRAGVAGLLQQMFPDMQIFEADHVNQGLEIACANCLQLVILDLQTPDQEGFADLIALRSAFPQLSVVMFAAQDNQELILEALRLGAMGFISKDLSRQDLVEALLDVLAGKVYLPPALMGGGQLPKASPELRTITEPEALGLTPREFSVLSLLVQGMCNKEIARLMGICEQTVKNHMRTLFLKFAVTKRVELLVKLFVMGVVIGKPSNLP